MKKMLLFGAIVTAASSFGQMQIGNSDMEQWEAVPGGQEPVNWNSFLSAQGGLTSFAANQVEVSTNVRPGSTGTKSARIWSRNAGFVIANGNLTVGRINMGSPTPANAANYNISLTADSLYSEPLTDTPDSLVFWARFAPDDTVASRARVKATLHDNYNYRDPEDAVSSTHVVAIAEHNYPKTNGWKRISVPFVYSGPATGNTNILITFTTNMTPGGGDPDDEVLLDDIQLIYNTNQLTVLEKEPVAAYLNNNSNELVFSEKIQDGQYVVYNALGQIMQKGEIDHTVPFEQAAGIYFVHVATKEGVSTFEVFKR